MLRGLMSRSPNVFYKSLIDIETRGGTDLVSAVIFASRFSAVPQRDVDATLAKLTGDSEPKGWFEWMLWQESHPEIASHPAFYEFKRAVFLEIDPDFDVFLDPAHIAPDAMKIRFEEVTWGGVRKDGIPSLDHPDLIGAAEAEYLLDDDLVFGVSINGDVRAYPLRIMGWHEMFNEVIGGVPVALAYCTLCGAGILFDTQPPGRQTPYVFGSSGFLYRSNKLMFDRGTHSLWNQFTGRPVSGRLADRDIELPQRPVVIAEWREWRRSNPSTKVLSVKTGHRRDYGSGVVYQDYFASDALMFPAFLADDSLAQKDYVFGVRLPGGAKAWPLMAFKGGRVINDTVGFQNLVLVGDEATRTVRAFDRGDLTFDQDLATDGARWTLTEDALVAPDGRKAPRVAGHVAYWFAWAGYLGDASETYDR
ncbi:MAG: DUF3179 domain-containing protein [Rhodobacteraceae bacterium]|nr:MAG: DUF3179 domain-containing protein [Paracoccaceae bacterium]